MLNSRQAFPKKEHGVTNLVSSSTTSNTYYKIKTIPKLQNNTSSAVFVSDQSKNSFAKQQASSVELPDDQIYLNQAAYP